MENNSLVVEGLRSKSKTHSYGIVITAALVLGVIITNIMMFDFTYQRIDRDIQNVGKLRMAMIGKGNSYQVELYCWRKKNKKLSIGRIFLFSVFL